MQTWGRFGLIFKKGVETGQQENMLDHAYNANTVEVILLNCLIVLYITDGTQRNKNIVGTWNSLFAVIKKRAENNSSEFNV